MRFLVKMLFIAGIVWIVTGVFSTATAQQRIEDPERARAVFDEMDQRRNSIDTEEATLQMIITDPRGRTRTRTLRSWSQNRGEESMSLLVFSDPGNVRGTAFLSLTEAGVETQRLWLPAVGRVQLISASERGDRFMGSDFTYEDLGDQSSDDFEFEWLIEAETVYTIRAIALTSPLYSFVEFDVNRNKYVLEAVRYYDRENVMIRRLVAEEFEQLTERLWSATKMTMYDLREERNTELIWSDREINGEIEEWRFTERGLRRGI